MEWLSILHCFQLLRTCRLALAAAMLLAAGLLPLAVRAESGASAKHLSLSLSDAVQQALRTNLETKLAAESVEQARGEKGLGRSALLPNLSGAVYQMNLTSNLAAMGLGPGKIPGLDPFIGPFNRFDGRLQIVQNVFNLAAVRRYQASAHGLALARNEERSAAQRVVIATVLAYLAVAEAHQSVQAAEADVELAKRLLDLAVNQRNAGVATGMDVARAETRLANQQVRLVETRTQLEGAKLELLRVIGAPLDSELELADTMQFHPEPIPDVDVALRQALAERPELRSAEEQVLIAKAQKQAALAEWTPSVSFFGDYGGSGVTLKETNLPTRSVGLRLEVPIFDGGRTRSEFQIASSKLRQAEMRRDDLRAAVEKEVRLALENLAARRDQVIAAQKTLALAERELELARDRFQNGVADNIEVLNAQTQIENAREALVRSLALFNVARLNLAAALGRVENFHL